MEATDPRIEHLKPGSFYKFTHTRKGEFYARYEGIAYRHGEPYIDVSILTADGSGQAYYANSMVHTAAGKRYPVWSRKHLLPELVLNVDTPPIKEQERWQSMAESAEKQMTEAGPPPTYAMKEPASAAPIIDKTKLTEDNKRSLIKLLPALPIPVAIAVLIILLL